MADAPQVLVIDCSLAPSDEGHQTLAPLSEDELAQRAADAAAVTTAQQQTSDERTATTRLQQRALGAVAQLETADTNWASLTSAQKDAAARLSVRVNAALIRLLLRES